MQSKRRGRREAGRDATHRKSIVHSRGGHDAILSDRPSGVSGLLWPMPWRDDGVWRSRSDPPAPQVPPLDPPAFSFRPVTTAATPLDATWMGGPRLPRKAARLRGQSVRRCERLRAWVHLGGR